MIDKNDDLTSIGHAVIAETHDQLLPMIETVINGYADSGTQVVFFLFGAVADATGFNQEYPNEAELGFVIRAITIDGRQLTGFLKLVRGEDDMLAVDLGRTAIIQVSEESDFEDDLMGTLATGYIKRYNERRQGKEILH